MPGTKEGGLKSAITIKQRYGEDYFKRTGKLGGLKSKGGGFQQGDELNKLAGRLGGTKSRKNAKINKPIDEDEIREIKSKIMEYKILKYNKGVRNVKE